MKEKFIFLVIILLIQSLNADPQRGRRSGKKEDRRTQKITLSVYPMAKIGSDSVRLLTYVSVPYDALQFLKEKEKYYSNFETFISLKNADGDQLSSRSWIKEVSAEDYLTTISKKYKIIHFHEFLIPPGKYNIVSEIIDKDINKSLLKEINLDITRYNQKVVLNKPFFIDYLAGYWGFKEDELPLLTNRLQESTLRTSVFVSGRVVPGTFVLNVSVDGNRDSVMWGKDFQMSSESGIFMQRVIIPKEITLKGFRKKITVKILQNGKNYIKTLDFSINKPGFTSSIQNIPMAIKQMRYIFKDDERKVLLSAKNKEEQETLFLEFWNKKDPTPNTLKNELMDEYFNRVNYSNNNFKSHQPGWRTDFGMIYILFGPPDDIEVSSNPSRRIYIKRWHYYKINQIYEFVDENGFGDYRLTNPFFRGRNW
ncbi:MAG: GWxTD domain-containing protein [Candidatus Neomarinimicrobiota bacterium]